VPQPSAADVVAFWREAGPARWYAKDAVFDAEIRERFVALHHAAARRELTGWGDTAEGALALLLLLDQFPRNLWRNSAHAFATDALARIEAARAIEAGHDKSLSLELRVFFYLPFEHSELLADQERCLALTRRLAADGGDPDLIKWAQLHHDIIARFDRFPHRNAALGRETTPEEQAFLDGGGFTG
jgi:uncharacterized protein (DUF924 family)